jgi:septum formation protein
MPGPHTFIYLASQSPRRRQLLEQIGVAYRPLLPDPAEDIELLEQPRSREAPRDYVHRVTRLKLDAARARLARRKLAVAPILCSDTTVALGRRILGKPADPEAAREALHALSGRTHRVLTAVCVSSGPHHLFALNESKVRFAALSDVAIQRYVDSGEPQGKAGSYAIQSQAAQWVQHIEGSYSGIMGLPLFETAQLLRQAGVLF